MAMPEWTDARLNDAFDVLRKDNALLRDEMREDMRSLRAEITAELRAFREEMRAELRTLRADVQTETASVRTDVRAGVRTFWVVLIASYVSLLGAVIATQL